MSTIRFSFTTQALDFAPLNRGIVTVVFNDGSMNIELKLRLTTGTAVSGYFKEVAWVGGQTAQTSNQQAANYAASFNRDFKGIGGAKNLGSRVITGTNEVEVECKNGTFVGASYSGNIFTFAQGVINNEVFIPTLAISASQSAVGDCNNITYNVSASGGVAPYSLTYKNVEVLSNWNGVSNPVSITRGEVIKLVVFDSSGLVKERTLTIPRKLIIGEFKENITQFEDASDILVENLNVVNGTTPIQYSLDDENAATGMNYSTSNSFPQVLPGVYRLFVKDKYDCEVSKLINITAVNEENADQNLRYFEISHANSFIMTELVDLEDPNIKKNFYNSFDKYYPRSVVHKFYQRLLNNDVVRTQIKSSYPFHICTLHNCNGGKVDQPVITIQENLGAREKVDCKLFIVDGKTGMYFDGGNEYLPNTDTIIGNSDYVKYTPTWAKVNQVVNIETLGSFKISELGFDKDLDRGYAILENLAIGGAQDAKVQVLYNIQPYNVLETYTFASSIAGGKAKLVIEKGLAFDQIDGNPWVSEDIVITENYDDLLDIKFNSSKNVAGLVFQSQYEGIIRLEGRVTEVFSGESEGFDGDQNYYPLVDTLFLRHELTTQYITGKMAYKLAIVTALDGFQVNGIKCRRSDFPEITPLGDSNLYTFRCVLAATGNDLAQQQDELVLNPSTGVIGGGSETGKSPVAPTYDNKIRLKDSGFITVDGKFIEI